MQHWSFSSIDFLQNIESVGLHICTTTTGKKGRKKKGKRCNASRSSHKIQESPRLPGSPLKPRGTMSSTRFKKDKEIIADYETQVKGTVWMGCLRLRCVCIVSAEAWPSAQPKPAPVSLHVFSPLQRLYRVKRGASTSLFPIGTIRTLWHVHSQSHDTSIGVWGARWPPPPPLLSRVNVSLIQHRPERFVWLGSRFCALLLGKTLPCVEINACRMEGISALLHRIPAHSWGGGVGDAGDINVSYSVSLYGLWFELASALIHRPGDTHPSSCLWFSVSDWFFSALTCRHG